LARTEFVLKYKGSVFGYLWSLVSPLLLFGVLYVAFTKVFRVGGDIPHYAVLLLLNLTLFDFFADTTSRAMTAMVARESVVRKMEFPRLALPLSIVLASTFTLVLNLIVVVGFALATGVHPIWTWLLFPVLLLYLYGFTVGCSLLLSPAFIRFRDTAQIWIVITRAMFYASPVLFPIEFFPAGAKIALAVNPLAPLFAESRIWFLDPGAPTFGEVMGSSAYLIFPLFFYALVVVVGTWLFQHDAPHVAEEL
jgi:ABC-2 type transport system permease protein